MLLAHAKCEDGAKNLSISILISRKGVPFSDGTIVNFIALLATPDNKCHLRALNELVEVFQIMNLLIKSINHLLWIKYMSLFIITNLNLIQLRRKVKMEFKRDCFYADLHASSKEEVLKLMSDGLLQNNIVNEFYYDKVMERENCIQQVYRQV